MGRLGAVTAPIWLDLLDETARLCQAYGRTDLLERLRQQRSQLLDPQLRVVVSGEPKQGKSLLINALINAPVCPVGEGPGVSVPVVVRYAEQPSAVLVRTPLPGSQPSPDPSRTEQRTSVPVDQLASWLRRLSQPRRDTEALRVEVSMPRALLASGLVLIDTPGVDNLHEASSPHSGLPRGDVLLLVSDATRELSVTELNLLLQLRPSYPFVIIALTKIDISPNWRAVAERNREQLASAGISAVLMPVSNVLRLHAARANDKDINEESGFPQLIAGLASCLANKSGSLAATAAGLTARTVLEQLAAPLRAELVNHPEKDSSGSMTRLRQAQAAVDELRRTTTRWQNTLNDEIGDLLADIEYDLRDRTRQILRTVDEAFDEADPLPSWPVFQEWLEANLVQAAAANYTWLVRRCEWIAQRVADNFRGYGYDVVPDWSLLPVEEATAEVPAIDPPKVERSTPIQKLMTGLRGSYGGVLMVGLATSLAGMPLLNPISLGAGALFGGKSIRDEGRSLLKQRQAAAKAVVQRHVDEFFMRLNKDRRDTIRAVQRRLRDHFLAVTEELQEVIVHSFRSAKQEADADAVEWNHRQRHLAHEMRRLTALYEQAQELLAPQGETGRAVRVATR